MTPRACCISNEDDGNINRRQGANWPADDKDDRDDCNRE